MTLSTHGRTPRVEFNEERASPFVNLTSRPARVVVDPRTLLSKVNPLLADLLKFPEILLGTAGPDIDDTIQLHPEVNGAVPVTLEGRNSWVNLDNLGPYAAARAKLHEVDHAELREGLILTEACDLWNADLFITDSPGLATSAGNYSRLVRVLDVHEALPLIALLLRSRTTCPVPRRFGAVSMLDTLPPWWFYRVGAWARVSQSHTWKERWPQAPATGLLSLHDGLPVEGIIGRISRALRARDRVLVGMLGLEGNESHDLVLYETESLALQLAGALDAAADAACEQLVPGVGPAARKLHNKDFKKEVGKHLNVKSRADLALWSDLSELLGLIRNRIHGQPPTPVAGNDNQLWFLLPKQQQPKFAILAAKLGSPADWGVHRTATPDFYLIDPWILAERAVASTCAVLQELCGTFADLLPVQPTKATAVQPWPWDSATAATALELLGL